MKTIATLMSSIFIMIASVSAGEDQQTPLVYNANTESGISKPLRISGTTKPRVVKSNYSGFVREEYVRDEICELFDHKIVITRRYGKLQTEQVIHLDTRGSLSLIINQAFAEEVVKGGLAPCDGPTTVVTVNRWVPENGLREFTIHNSGGCGQIPEMRTGPASRVLMDMLGQYCPNTIPIQIGD